MLEIKCGLQLSMRERPQRAKLTWRELGDVGLHSPRQWKAQGCLPRLPHPVGADAAQRGALLHRSEPITLHEIEIVCRKNTFVSQRPFVCPKPVLVNRSFSV
eukprot:COSAG06_NODE_2947_length_6044_cov_2.985029_3_plen_102_part_00